MTKTITAAFEEPDKSQIITIQLADTRGIAVGMRLQIGFDSYLIIKIEAASVLVKREKKLIPVGTECLILES